MSQGPGRIKLLSLKNQALIADKCHVAECFFDRLRGLIGKSGMGPGEGMLFPRCNSIHMWFMRFSIDVVFIRTEKRSDGTMTRKVTSVHSGVHPWKLLPLTDWRANETLELPGGTIRQCAVEAGDELCTS